MKSLSRVLAATLLALSISVSAAPQEKIPSGRDVVSTSTFASLEPAARGKSFQIAVVLKIRPGFHINARETSADYLIATDLQADIPAGFHSGNIQYPKGQLHTFTFSKTPLNVYQDTVTLRVPLTALATAPLGEQRIALKLRYQACSQEVCLPPVTVPLDTVITVAAAARAAHPDIFSTR